MIGVFVLSGVVNAARYLAAVVTEFEQDCQDQTGFDLKRRLWKAAVIVFENAPDPQPWLDQLENAASSAGMRMTAILATFRSAERRVNSR